MPGFACRVPDCDARKPVPAPVSSVPARPARARPARAVRGLRWGLLHPAEQRMYAEGDLSDAGVVTAASFRRALARVGKGAR